MIAKRILMYTVTLLFLTACSHENSEKENKPVIVKTSQVELSTGENNHEYSFISKPFKETDLSFRVGGPIDRFEVYAGNHYKRGNIIAEIDPRDFRIRKERAEAIYQQARAEFERIQTLYEKNNISASNYEKARAEYTSAKTAYEVATNELNDTRLVAPFDGYAGEVYIEKFQDVKATQPIISFMDISQLKIEAYVTQDIAFNAQNLAEVKLRFDAQPDTLYSAKVVELSRSTTRNNLSYLLTALLPNSNYNLLAGMSGKVFFDLSSSQKTPAVIIPQAALCHRPTEGDYVWVVNPPSQKAEKRNITLGNLLPNGKVSVIDGLQPNETIAVSGLRFLSDGMNIETYSN